MVLTTEWAQVEAIDLTNDGSGLGFGIIGGRSTGVVVKTVLPGSVADRDGRLQSGDHILQIGEVNLRGMGSEQVAMVLRQSGSHVRLIVARPVEPTSPSYHVLHNTAPIVPTRLLSDPEEVERHLTMFHQTAQNGFAPQYTEHHFSALTDSAPPLDSVQLDLHVEHQVSTSQPEKPQLHQYHQLQQVPEEDDSPEMEIVEAQLAKNQQGLGITVAGYVCEKEEISGIFIKSIMKGSAADVCGKLHVNDQIIEVDDRALQGYTNHQAVEVLRNTGKEVKLRLARYLRGAKYEQLQQAISTGEFCVTATTQVQIHEPKPNMSNLVFENNTSRSDSLPYCYNYTLPIDSTTEAEIQARWKKALGGAYTIVIAQLSKFEDNGGLGISLEGTVDVENGKEVRPHHYIGSILPSGPVGKNGSLCSGDELLEANGKILLGLNHREVVTTLKELPKNVCLVCARHSDPSNKDFHMSPIYHSTPKKSSTQCGKLAQKEIVPKRLVKAKSDGYLIVGLSLISSVHTALSKLKSRSLEPLTNLATWSSESQIVELMKGDNGLGFSVLDYQDPMNLNETVIVVRSLVPGGVAQQDGRLIPGDRLLFVNDFNLENASLDTAVHALQGVPKGLVRIGIAKPLPCPESSYNTQTPLDDSSDSKELLSDNCAKSINASSSFDSGEILNEQLWKTPHYQTSLTPSSLLSGGLDSSGSTPLSSPAFSPSVTKSGDDIPPLPSALERIVRVKKGTDKLGLSVELVEKGINGMIVKSISPDSALEKDGNICVGDYVLSVNNESMRKITKSQARAILKRVELLNTDITIKYVPGPDAAVYHQSVLMNLQQGRESPSIILPRQLSPRIFPKYYRSPFFQSKVHEDTTDGELSESSFVRSLPLSERQGSYEQILSPYTATSGGMSTVPTPSSFSTDFSELKQSEEIGYSEDDADKDLIMEDEFQPDLSQEKVTTNEEEKSAENIISPSFEEIRAIFLTKSASEPLVPSKPVKKPSLTSQDIVLDGITNVASENGSQNTMHANKSLTSEETLVNPSYPNSLPLWGPKRLVEIWKEQSSNLGIVIAKGVINIGQNTSDSTISGIFIKTVLPESPADETGAIKSGDRILEVNDVDLDGVAYEDAVELIKNAKIPIKFLLQSPVSLNIPNNSPNLCITEALTNSETVEENVKEMSPTVEDSSIISLIPDPMLLAPRRLSDKIEIMSTSIEGSDEEEEDNEDNRQLQGKIYSKKGYEIDRASAAFAEEITGDEGEEEEDDFGYTEKKIQKKYGDMNGEIVIVELQKGINGLGLSLAGNKDRTKMSVFVCGIHPSGSAAKDGRIRIGDELLEVNGLVLYGRCHLNASAMIKGLSGNVYKMIFLRKEDVLDDMAIKPLTQFPMYLAEETQEERFAKYGSVRKVTTRKGPQGLGIMIIEGKHTEVGQGIFISDIQDGSPAKQAGLNVGDMILAVNQTELIGSDYDTAATVLKQVDGSITMVIANPNKPSGIDEKEVKGPEQSEKMMVKRLSKREKRNTSKFGHFPVKSSIINCRSRMSGGTKPHALSLSAHFSQYTSSRASHFSTLPTLPSTLLDGTSSLPEEPIEPPADPRTCDIRPGHETTIEINKEKTGLGLNIVGGSDTPLSAVIIHEVYPNGAAAADGRLQPGDQILELNGESLRHASHEHAITTLQKSPSVVQLIVYREPEENHEKRYDVLQIEIYKKSGRGLGLSIVGRKNGPGVFISEVVKGGVAEADGRLMQGDQILEVNGIDLKSSSQEHAAAILKTTVGKVNMKIGRLKAGSMHNSPGSPDLVESLGISRVERGTAKEVQPNLSIQKTNVDSQDKGLIF